MKTTLGGGLVCAFGGILVAGCMSAELDAQPTGDERVALAIAPIIGGMPADSPTLDAIGSVSRVARSVVVPPFPGTPSVPPIITPPNVTPPLSSTCTGTLIDADTVVTAKHCIDGFGSLNEGELVFTVGPDSKNPRATSEVVAVEGAPGDEGGFTGYGHDVAVLQLKTPISDVVPIGVGTLGDEHIGQAFVSIGYGVQDNSRTAGQRLAGEGELRARSGRTLEVLFGSFEAYFEQEFGLEVPQDCPELPAPAPGTTPPVPTRPGPFPGPSDPCTLLEMARAEYDRLLLEEMQEVVVGVADGGAQPCYGDSGGPLLQLDAAGKLVTYGVVSGGHGSDEQVCDYGTVYAGYPTDVLQFVQDAMVWVDPCRDVPTEGSCEGSVAKRCSTLAEGERRVLTFDCARLGLACVIGEDAAASCGDAAAEPPAEAPVPEEPTPTPEEPAPAPSEPAPAPTP